MQSRKHSARGAARRAKLFFLATPRSIYLSRVKLKSMWRATSAKRNSCPLKRPLIRQGDCPWCAIKGVRVLVYCNARGDCYISVGGTLLMGSPDEQIWQGCLRYKCLTDTRMQFCITKIKLFKTFGEGTGILEAPNTTKTEQLAAIRSLDVVQRVCAQVCALQHKYSDAIRALNNFSSLTGSPRAVTAAECQAIAFRHQFTAHRKGAPQSRFAVDA